MKRFLSVLISVCLLASLFSISFSAEAASKPKKVEGLTATLTIDRYAKKVYTKAKWKKQKGVSGYQVKFGAIDDFDDSGKVYYFKTKTLKGAKKTSAKINHDYATSDVCNYVKVRAYKLKGKKKIYGAWKRVKVKFRTINQVKGFKGETIDNHHSSRKVKFSWNTVKGASGYQIQYRQFYSDEWEIINVSGNKSSVTKWVGSIEDAKIRYYKIKDGKKVYGDFSDKTLSFELI